MFQENVSLRMKIKLTHTTGISAGGLSLPVDIINSVGILLYCQTYTTF